MGLEQCCLITHGHAGQLPGCPTSIWAPY